VLGLWAGNGAGESAKFWLSVLTGPVAFWPDTS
jgi:hypothetical protein